MKGGVQAMTMDYPTQPIVGGQSDTNPSWNSYLETAGLKTAGMTFYKIRSNEVYNLFCFSLMCSNLKKKHVDT